MAETGGGNEISIRSRDDLKAFLLGRDRRDAVSIVIRIALRIVPYARSFKGPLSKRLMLAIFRAMLLAQRAPTNNVASSAAAKSAANVASAADAASNAAAYAAASVASISAVAASTDSTAVHIFAANAASLTVANIDARAWRVFEADCRQLAEIGCDQMMASNLWQGAPPEWTQSEIFAFNGRLSDMGIPWPLIATWYDQILTNAAIDPFPVQALNEVANESEEFWGDGEDNPRTPDIVMAEIAERLGWGIPKLPGQAPGLGFEVTADAKIGVANSGIPVNDNDKAEIEAFRDVLIGLANELSESCSRSNAYSYLQPHLNRYVSELGGDIDTLSLDKLHAYGVILNRSHEQFKQDIKDDILPAPDAPIAVGLESLLALHGPTVAGTVRIQEIMQRPNPLSDDSFDADLYIGAVGPIIDAAVATPEFLDDEAKAVLPALSDSVSGSSQPGRTLETSKTATTNFLVTVARVAREWMLKPLVGTAVVDLVLTGGTNITASVAQMSHLAELCANYLGTNAAALRALVLASGADLYWLNSVLDWIERNRRRTR